MPKQQKCANLNLEDNRGSISRGRISVYQSFDFPRALSVQNGKAKIPQEIRFRKRTYLSKDGS